MNFTRYCFHCEAQEDLCIGQYMAARNCYLFSDDKYNNPGYVLFFMSTIMDDCLCNYCCEAKEVADLISDLHLDIVDKKVWHLKVPCCPKCPSWRDLHNFCIENNEDKDNEFFHRYIHDLEINCSRLALRMGLIKEGKYTAEFKELLSSESKSFE